MSFPLTDSSRVKVITLIVMSSLAVSVIYVWFSVQAHFTASPVLGVQRDDKPEVELITITPDGFVPAEIKRAEGKFLFVVDDRSGLSETILSFDRLVGNNQKEKVKERNIQRSLPLWTEEHKLQPGEYELTEASHPKWKCLITISAK